VLSNIGIRGRAVVHQLQTRSCLVSRRLRTPICAQSRLDRGLFLPLHVPHPCSPIDVSAKQVIVDHLDFSRQTSQFLCVPSILRYLCLRRCPTTLLHQSHNFLLIGRQCYRPHPAMPIPPVLSYSNSIPTASRLLPV